VIPVSGDSINPKYRNHAVTVITYFGKLLLSTKDNLFEVITGMDSRYLVDSQIPWETLSALPKNANKAFILGTTVDKERPSSLSLFENKDGLKVRLNVFLFGMKNAAPEDVPIIGKAPQLWIQQLDAHCFDVLNRKAMIAWEKAGKIWNDSQSVNEEKIETLKLLGVSSIVQLEQETYETRQAKHHSLTERIRVERGSCFKDFMMSNQVSRYAFARLLLNRRKARNEFSAPSKRHLLGDMQLIQNALFWNAAVLSHDGGVRMMAQFCGIKCRKTP
jgi:hypothetical protein